MTPADSLSSHERAAVTVGAVCVLFGARQMPPILRELAARDVDVVVVDNSGDLDPDEITGANPRVVSPGRNLGYSRGINAGVRALSDVPDALLVVNPDIVGDPESLMSFATQVARCEGPVLAAPTGGEGHFGFLPRAPWWLVLGHYLLRTSWHPTPRSDDDRFLSGALLGLNREALDRLAPQGHLLDPTLFFMDDVELSDRARQHGVRVAELRSDGGLTHEGGTSMRRRPAVRIYFSRVSKVRYWHGRSPTVGELLRAFFMVESAIGRVASGRQVPDGSTAHGFSATMRWLRHGDARIDEEILGNTGRPPVVDRAGDQHA